LENQSKKVLPKKIKFKESFVSDYFYHKDNKILILENDAFKNMEKDVLILAKAEQTENETIIKPLTDEEYEQAIRKYNAIIEIFSDETNEEDR